VLQLEEHRQRKTVDHFRFVERDKFRLVQDRVAQCAEHHLKREADAPRLRRNPAAAHPRKQERRGEIDHAGSGGADRSPSLRIDTFILRGRADDTDVAAHDIDGDFNDPSTRLFQTRIRIVLIGYRRAVAWELPIMGTDFTLWRLIISLPLPVLAGALGRFVYVRMYPKAAP